MSDNIIKSEALVLAMLETLPEEEHSSFRAWANLHATLVSREVFAALVTDIALVALDRVSEGLQAGGGTPKAAACFSESNGMVAIGDAVLDLIDIIDKELDALGEHAA